MPWLVLFAGSWLCWASDKRGSWHADAAADAADRGEFGLRNIVLNNVPTCDADCRHRVMEEMKRTREANPSQAMARARGQAGAAWRRPPCAAGPHHA